MMRIVVVSVCEPRLMYNNIFFALLCYAMLCFALRCFEGERAAQLAAAW
eukprot:COSAG01_NODE_37958_length_496_cov_1.801008_2_plen_48_part_01